MPYKDKNKQRSYQRRYVAKNRADWIKANGPCRHCGSRRKLEVDHRDPSTKISHSVWSWSSARRDEELSKCQVLCSRCHKKKTSAAIPEPPHGTHSRYIHRRCRCDACRLGHAKMNAKYRGPKE